VDADAEDVAEVGATEPALLPELVLLEDAPHPDIASDAANTKPNPTPANDLVEDSERPNKNDATCFRMSVSPLSIGFCKNGIRTLDACNRRAKAQWLNQAPVPN
jgi:hypothetical protein